jgi:hypothetical protein
MKSLTFNLTAIIFFALSIMFGLRAEEKKLNVSKGDKLVININYGEISISTWDKNELVIKSDAKINGHEKELEISQAGRVVTVTGGSDGSDIFISAPYDFNFDVRTGAGSVSIKGNISGKVELRTSGGDITTDNIYGSLDVSTSGGNVIIGNVKGGAKINSGGGDLKAGDIEGDIVLKTGGGSVKVGKVTKSLKLKTGGGNILVTGSGSDAVINTGGGNILVDKSDGKLELTTGGGDIRLNNPKDELIAKTGSGSIYVQNASGKMNIYTGSGDADIFCTSSYKGNSEIKTNNGDVILNLPPNIKATVTAKVNSRGSSDQNDSDIDNIKSDFKATTIDRHKDENVIIVVYQINGGGGNINVTVANGSIELKKSGNTR